MPNCDFYAAGEDYRLIVEFEFAETSCRIFELSSQPNAPLLEGRSFAELKAIEKYEQEAKRLGMPVLIGHSMGGLIVQQLLSRGAGALGIAIDSAPPLGVRSFALSHLRANAPVLWPGNSPIEPTVDSWRYAFWHTGPAAEVRAAFDREVVPESRLVGKAPLGEAGRVDFAKQRPPLLMIAGELDHIIPASLNRANAARYDATAAPTELLELKGRTHCLCGQPGWEEVAAACLAWVDKRRASRAA